MELDLEKEMAWNYWNKPTVFNINYANNDTNFAVVSTGGDQNIQSTSNGFFKYFTGYGLF